MNELNNIKNFIGSQCKFDTENKVEGQKLYDSCKLWYAAFGKPLVIGTRTFYDILKQLGYEVRKSTNNKLFVFGITLKGE